MRRRVQRQIGSDQSQRTDALARQLLRATVRNIVQLRHGLLHLFPCPGRNMLRVVNHTGNGLIRHPRKEGNIIEGNGFHAFRLGVNRAVYCGTARPLIPVSASQN